MRILLLLLISCLTQAVQADDFKLQFPVNCQLNNDCFILSYPSHPDNLDYSCGTLTQEKYPATNIALANEKQMTKGFEVVAVADGVVKKVTGTIQDIPYKEKHNPEYALNNDICGNGIVIDHNNGWQSFYCYLKQASIKVLPETKVKAGQVIALVGQSGYVGMPMLGFTIASNGQSMDPFMSKSTLEPCSKEPSSQMWQEPIAYKPHGVIDSGFTRRSVELVDVISADPVLEEPLTKDDNIMIFWTQAYGVQDNDLEVVSIYKPDKTLFFISDNAVDARNLMYVSSNGRKLTKGGFETGMWTAKYSVQRNGQELFGIEKTFTVK